MKLQVKEEDTSVWLWTHTGAGTRSQLGTTLPFPIIGRDTTLSILFSISARFPLPPVPTEPTEKVLARNDSFTLTSGTFT